MSLTADNTIQYDAIVVGAGVVGPAVATAFARQGRKVLLIERDWTQPDRIVGELMQPSGLKALKSLGMIEAVNGIDAIHVDGYSIHYHGEKLIIDYPFKSSTHKLAEVPHCATNTNTKIVTDNTLDSKYFDSNEREVGVAFRHGEFIMNMRKIARKEPNVTALKGTVTRLEKNENNHVIGVRVNETNKSGVLYKAHLTVCCDGIFSKFRKHMGADNTPNVGSHFISLTLENAKLPSPNHGHVIISHEAPILIYQISPVETRILCAYRSAKLPTLNDAKLKNYLHETVYEIIPDSVRPSYKNALKNSRIRIMPNSYLTAKRNETPGLLFIGDALNMRHPLTGGGMTVGLNDAALIAKLLSPEKVLDFSDTSKVLDQVLDFHHERKSLGSVINVLSIALYSLFSADTKYLQILQKGCYNYLMKIPEPIGLLSGLVPEPFVLFKHFFSVAFFSILFNFRENGLAMFPISVYESILTLYTAIVVFTPYMWNELIS